MIWRWWQKLVFSKRGDKNIDMWIVGKTKLNFQGAFSAPHVTAAVSSCIQRWRIYARPPHIPPMATYWRIQPRDIQLSALLSAHRHLLSPNTVFDTSQATWANGIVVHPPTTIAVSFVCTNALPASCCNTLEPSLVMNSLHCYYLLIILINREHTPWR